jgi:hypothetical protein
LEHRYLTEKRCKKMKVIIMKEVKNAIIESDNEQSTLNSPSPKKKKDRGFSWGREEISFKM